MRTSKLVLCSAALGMMLLLTACKHRLVAPQGERNVSVYPDEETWRKIAQMKQQGGVSGMLGGLGQNLAAKQVDDGAAVRIISSDSDGSMVEVTAGPFKGTTGFVPKENVKLGF